jgi:putative ABC transport system substrate-binding protein
MHHLAIVHPSAPAADLIQATNGPVLQALQRLGYIEGQNLVIERWTAEGRPERYGEIASDVVAYKPDVVFLPTGRLAQAFKRVTSTVPIVVLVGSDPIPMGIVENLSHPEANITGFTTEAGPAFLGKLFQIMKDLKPTMRKFGFLAARQAWQSVLASTSQSLGISVVGPMVESPFGEQEHRVALNSMIDDGIEGLVLSTTFESVAHRRMIIQLVQDHRLPAIYPLPQYARDGGLLAYTADFDEVFAGLAAYLDLILKGAKPGDLPFLQPTKFQFTINMKAARAIDLNIPAPLLASADKVIE